jgi:hypothetical protein
VAYAGRRPTIRRSRWPLVFRGQTARDRRSLLTGYLISSLGLSIGAGVFLFAFLF